MRQNVRFFNALLVFAIVCALLIGGTALMRSGEGFARPSMSFGGAEAGLITIEGVIMASGGDGGAFGGSGGVSSMRVVKEINEYVDDNSIKGIIVRIDSPGGSAAASDEIWSALRKAKEKKKVVVSMGDVAASGGYYIATAADFIYANQSTLTGSIGVIFEGMEFSGLFEKLGIGTTTIKAGKDKDIGSINRPMTAEEKAMLQALLDEVHEQFIGRVAEGRNLAVEEVRKIATGMVFTGEQAKELHLIDEVGSFDDAFAKLEELCDEDLTLREPPPPSFWDFFMNPGLTKLPPTFQGMESPLSRLAAVLYLNGLLAEMRMR
ncbi:MAG: signal peptide peptidase SppA [bacterium]|jgi:protease-4